MKKGSWFTVLGSRFNGFRKSSIVNRQSSIILCVLCVLCGLVYAEKAIINSFNTGEVTGELAARTDLRLAYSSVRLMENFYIQTHGGAAKRPGTYYIAEAADSDVAGRLIGFGHSTGTNNVLEFGEKTIRFYRGE